jgi:hypothetical protein
LKKVYNVKRPGQALAVLAFILIASAMTHAQATRTWVSGVGDDVNPCSRTAPCKTFAGAISKTAIAGEIDVLDPGAYGIVTITKSIIIDGGGMFAPILSSGSPSGVVVNLTTGNDVDPEKRVVLRRLSLNGTGSCGAGCGASSGLRGINALNFKTLDVENCYIQNFTTVGIDVNLGTPSSSVSVKDTNINNTVTGVQLTTGYASGYVGGMFDRVRVENGTNGIIAKDRAYITISESTFANNSMVGVAIQAPSNAAGVNLENVVLFNNGTGIAAGGVGTKVDLSNTSVLNSFTGISSGGGIINSHGNNRFANNSSDGVTLIQVGQK